jgi:hypothetical protein
MAKWQNGFAEKPKIMAKWQNGFAEKPETMAKWQNGIEEKTTGLINGNVELRKKNWLN